MPIQCSDIFCTRYLYWLYDGISPISPKMFTQSVTWRVTNCHVCYQDKDEILTVMSPRLFFGVFPRNTSITHNLHLKWKLAM